MKAAGLTILFAPLLTGFVLLGKTGAKLPVSTDAPTVTFVWSTDGTAPELKEKDKFRDGAYGAYTHLDPRGDGSVEFSAGFLS
jgi:hypothetical protein